jgi:TonB-dependent SusC/RagA subfamily outer membrane receptor
VDANKPNIEQIRKYLNGELDARAMFELERQAEQDPFLWDMMRGMESSDENHEPNLNAIDELIKQRVEQNKKKVVPMWRYWPVAASLLIALGIGGWWVLHEPSVQAPIVLNTQKVAMPDKATIGKTTTDTQQVLPVGKKPLLAKLSKEKLYTPGHGYSNYESAAPVAMADKQFKTDTVEYKASAYPVKAKASVNELLKKLPGVDVDANGNVTAQGQQITKTRINGKDFNGADVNKAIKNLPADVVEKIQIIDDYGDQANKTAIKTGEPNKILNIVAKAATANGAADYESKINLRGISGVKGTNPLYVVDGVPKANFDINSLKKEDIKSIDILKDTASLGLYGFRAANGVVVVNTKKFEKSLKEVTIVGYGSQKKQTLTGSISSISPISIAVNPDSSNRALAGRVAGLDVTKAKGRLKAETESKTITGKVYDLNRNPLPGVSIRIEGTNTASQTDINGAFKITVPGQNAILHIAYIGYTAQQVKVKDKDNLNIALTGNSQSLSEVVVVGYGTSKDEQVVVFSHPSIGWKAYHQYVKEKAVLPGGKKGTVKVSFMVYSSGMIGDIDVDKGSSQEMNNKAIELIKGGSDWVGRSDGKPEKVKVKIKFHK